MYFFLCGWIFEEVYIWFVGVMKEVGIELGGLFEKFGYFGDFFDYLVVNGVSFEVLFVVYG